MKDNRGLWALNPLSRTLLESLDQGVLGLDSRYRVRMWNAWMANHTGLQAEAVEHRLFQEIFPDLPPSTLQSIQEVVSAGEPRVLSPIIHSKWLPAVKAKHQLVRLLPLTAEDRETAGLIIFIQDVTGTVVYEGGLEERYRTLVESFTDHIFMLDPNGIYLTSNNQVGHLDIQNRKNLVGLHFSDLYPEDVAELYREQMAKVLATGRQVRFEHKMPGPHGPRYHTDTLYPILRDKQVWAIGGTCRDITEKKTYEKELMVRTEITRAFATTQGDETYGEVLKIVLDAFVSRYGVFGYIDEDGVLNCPSFTGDIWESCQIPDKTVRHPSDRWGGIWGRALMEKRVLCSNQTSTVPEGHIPIRRSMASPIIYQGETIGLLHVANKKSDYHQMDLQLIETIAHTIAPLLHSTLQIGLKDKEKALIEDQLRQSQKMEAMGLLAGGVAHDFNNQLSVIAGNAELMVMDLGEHSPFKDGLEEIHRAANRAASLTRQLLTFSRRKIVRPQVISLNDVLTGLEKMLRRLIGENILFHTDPSPDLRLINMDPGHLEQVIMNLVVNARDAMPKGGALTIETANRDLDGAFFRDLGLQPAIGPYVMLNVTDSGVGMDRETQSHMFEPFFTTKPKGQGTGLGLATVYGIVKQAKGYVRALSEPGEGTTFEVYIPRTHEEERTVRRKRTTSPGVAGSETILLVEDDEMLQRLMKIVLTKEGYRVLLADDGEAAIAMSEGHEGNIELLLSDVVLPGIGGKDLSARLQEKRPEMKILFVSGYTDQIISHYGVVPSDMNFIEKPFSPGSLALKVREVLTQD